MVGIAQYRDRDPGHDMNTGSPHNPTVHAIKLVIIQIAILNDKFLTDLAKMNVVVIFYGFSYFLKQFSLCHIY